MVSAEPDPLLPLHDSIQLLGERRFSKTLAISRLAHDSSGISICIDNGSGYSRYIIALRCSEGLCSVRSAQCLTTARQQPRWQPEITVDVLPSRRMINVARFAGRLGSHQLTLALGRHGLGGGSISVG
jgi:hypothetical protein